MLQQLSMSTVNSLTILAIQLEDWLLIRRRYTQKQPWKFVPLFDIDYSSIYCEVATIAIV